MNEIVERLWISSRDVAVGAIATSMQQQSIATDPSSPAADMQSCDKEADALSCGGEVSLRIDALLAVGVPPATDDVKVHDGLCIDVLSIPHITDTPESNILELVEATTVFIKSHIDRGHSVLVHCQQGQSRSAAAIAAYLMIDRSMDLDSALTLLKEERACLSINPGFLSQLHLLHYRAEFPAEYRLLNRNIKSSELLTVPSDTLFARCRHCRYPLVRSDEILTVRDDIPTCEKFSDAFWQGFWLTPRKSSLTRPVLEGHIIVSPLIVREAEPRLVLGDRCKSNAGFNKSASALLCGKCRSPIGVLTRAGLAVGGGYILNDLLALSFDCIDRC